MLQLSQRPLTSSEADTTLFVDRVRELDWLQRAADLGFNVLALGDRGVGMTSLMFQHLGRREKAAQSVVRVSAIDASGPEEVLASVTVALERNRALESQSIERTEGSGSGGVLGVISTNEGPDTAHIAGSVTDPGGGSRSIIEGTPGSVLDELQRIREVVTDEGSRPTVIVDEFHDPSVAHQLFGRLRDELWELPVRWVVCGLAQLRSSYLEPPADRFFDAELSVDPLSTDAVRELVGHRLAESGEGEVEAVQRIRGQLDRIVDQAGGVPVAVMAAMRTAAMTGSAELAQVEHLLRKAGELGPSEVTLLRHLMVYGPASASDEELLASLDVTRSRATQVLLRLEEAGLLEASSEKSGVGRPRKVYALAAHSPQSDAPRTKSMSADRNAEAPE